MAKRKSMTEKCANFERWINPRKKLYNEVQICRVKGIGEIKCAGFREFCVYPKLFIPYNEVAIPTLKDIRDQVVRQLWDLNEAILSREIPDWSPNKIRRKNNAY